MTGSTTAFVPSPSALPASDPVQGQLRLPRVHPYPPFIYLLCVAFLASCATIDIGGPEAAKDNPDAGVLTVRGRTFYILPQDLNVTGEAKFTWPSGRVYEGGWVAGKRHGWGEDQQPNGQRYRGEWEDGLPSGQGILNMPDGSSYEGEFKHGVRFGKGRYTGNDGTYDGHWVADARHGAGKFEYSDSSVYDGAWERGKRHGFGVYTRPSGARYNGDWGNDMPDGFGQMVEPDGLTYSGRWQQGKRHGYGRIASRAGLSYEGTWNDDQRFGYGREARPDRSTYEGEWHGDRRSGFGTERAAVGTTHEGVWENNQPLGPGARSLATGVTISGLWNGNFVTSGLVQLPSGAEFAGDLYDAKSTVINPAFIAWLETRANAKDPHAALLLGDAYSKYSDPNPDLARAREYYRRAASANLPEAQYRLGLILVEQGQPNFGIGYLIKAADAAHAKAALLLGTYYQVGSLVPKDLREAIGYYTRAAQAGNVVAVNNLAWLLATTSDPALRDGPRAVQMLEPLAYFFRSWGYFDTLAAAYARAGEFTKASRVQKLALRLAANEDVTPNAATFEQMQSRLTLFQNRTPYVDNAAHPNPDLLKDVDTTSDQL